MAEQRALRAFVRLDANKKVVPSSLILRTQRPKNGRWQEILYSYCCDFRTASYVIPTLNNTANATVVVFGCGSTVYANAITLSGGNQAARISNLMTQLGGAPFTTYGTFTLSADSTTITFKPITACPPDKGPVVFSISYAGA